MLPQPTPDAPDPDQQPDSPQRLVDGLRARFLQALDTGEAGEFTRVTNFGSSVNGETQSALLAFLANRTPENRKSAELALERFIERRPESAQERSDRLRAQFDWARGTLAADEYDIYLRGPLLERSTQSALFEYLKCTTPENLQAAELALEQWIAGQR